jgi:hypothetical protein
MDGFQQLDLAAGLNHVIFVYFWPHMALGAIGLASGVLASVASLRRGCRTQLIAKAI